ncbi:MAG: sporulation protein [Burkholderiales bacterium]|nr:sporulation protein [Anaerolineae bacterium]
MVLDAAKHLLGIDGVRLELHIPSEIARNGTQFDGKLTVKTNHDDHVMKLTIRIVQEMVLGIGDTLAVDTTELGKAVIGEPFDIKAHEVREFDFRLPYHHELDESVEIRGAASEVIEFFVIAEADVRHGLDPHDKRAIHFV